MRGDRCDLGEIISQDGLFAFDAGIIYLARVSIVDPDDMPLQQGAECGMAVIEGSTGLRRKQKNIADQKTEQRARTGGGPTFITLLTSATGSGGTLSPDLM